MLSDHVLIVDDEASIRQILARWIKAIGYRTIEADCGEAGLAAMIANPAAVVFCDVQMPGQGGLWLAGVLRTQFPHAAIILATGVTTVPATTSLRPGILAYLTKPFDEPAVREALQRGMSGTMPRWRLARAVPSRPSLTPGCKPGSTRSSKRGRLRLDRVG